MFYKSLLQNVKNKKQFSLLIDPGKLAEKHLINTIKTADIADIDFFLVGGSLVSEKIDSCIKLIKKYSSKPVLLFPGSLLQLSDQADGVLFLSLISGRNPEYLIGNHVLAAPYLKKSSVEVISTGYILIGSGETTAVEYISNTKPIPPQKIDLIVATAIAGEMLGLKLIYLEAGSGASNAITTNIVTEVKKNINIPLIVGGGIKLPKDVENMCRAGADIVVVGNAIEQNYELAIEMASVNRV